MATSESTYERSGLEPIQGYDPTRDAGGFVFDIDRAALAVNFFPDCLTHVKGELAGQRFELEPWQATIVANMFGWIDPETLLRRYREVFIYIPRKSGKSMMAAGIQLYVLVSDGEAGAENYSAAADRVQAGLVFEMAKDMVRANEGLSDILKIYRSSIVWNDMGAAYKPISAEAYTKHGFNAHCICIDELHAHPSRELVDVLMTSTGARSQPLIVYITTADFDRPSICNEKLEYAEKVRDGIIEDPSFLPIVYGTSVDADWTDPDIWAAANPNLGKSIKLSHLKRECSKAIESPAYQNTFKRLHLNMKTNTDIRWLDLDQWDACTGDLAEVEALEGKRCFAGLDLSSTKDLTAFALWFPAERWVLAWHWIPLEGARRRERRDRVPYLTWARQGHIATMEGNRTDYDVVRAEINRLNSVYNISQLAIDRWNAGQIINQLGADGFDVVPFGQGIASMNAPTKELDALVASQGFSHGGNPVLRWMASNIVVEETAAGDIKPNKAKSTERIDGIVAIIMAIGLAITQPDPEESVYESHGLEFI